MSEPMPAPAREPVPLHPVELARPGLAPPPGPFAALVARVRAWRGDPRAGAVVLLVVAALAGLVWYRVGVAGDAPPATPLDRGALQRADRAASGVAAAPRATSTTVVVHVAGLVLHPGLARLPAGSRVADAIAAAGGPGAGADLDALNLAARLADGERIAVGRVGEAPPALAGDVAGASGASGPVHLNTATQPQLETLPGIGPSLAAAIIREREKRGGFRAVTDLQDVRGIGDARYAELEPLVAL